MKRDWFLTFPLLLCGSNADAEILSLVQLQCAHSHWCKKHFSCKKYLGFEETKHLFFQNPVVMFLVLVFVLEVYPAVYRPGAVMAVWFIDCIVLGRQESPGQPPFKSCHYYVTTSSTHTSTGAWLHLQNTPRSTTISINWFFSLHDVALSFYHVQFRKRGMLKMLKFASCSDWKNITTNMCRGQRSRRLVFSVSHLLSDIINFLTQCEVGPSGTLVQTYFVWYIIYWASVFSFCWDEISSTQFYSCVKCAMLERYTRNVERQ